MRRIRRLEWKRNITSSRSKLAEENEISVSNFARATINAIFLLGNDKKKSNGRIKLRVLIFPMLLYTSPCLLSASLFEKVRSFNWRSGYGQWARNDDNKIINTNKVQKDVSRPIIIFTITIILGDGKSCLFSFVLIEYNKKKSLIYTEKRWSKCLNYHAIFSYHSLRVLT